jgi:hypothetical protein
MPGSKRPPDGHISTTSIARTLGVDRRVLKRLWELGEVVGMRAGGVIWLERRSLAMYLWSRPRCARGDCARRVIGDGPGCARHRRSGRRHALSSRRKMSQTQGGEGLPERVCEWCGETFIGRGSRFCGKAHATAWRNALPGVGVRLGQLQEGNREFWAGVERVKKERELLGVEDLVDEPACPGQRFHAGLLRQAGVPRTAAAISDHIRNGWLERERDLGFDQPYLFTAPSVDKYVKRLLGEDPDVRLDGRLARWNPTTPEQAEMRGKLYRALHKSEGEFGRLALVKAKRSLAARETERLVAELWPQGLTHDEIGDHLAITPRYVRTIAQKLGLPKRRGGRRKKLGTTPQN